MSAQTELQEALAAGRDVLLEHELLTVLGAMGLPVPRHRFIEVGALETPLELGELAGIDGAVLKVVSPEILHKSDVGGVVFLARATPKSVAAAAREMLAALPAELQRGVLGVVLEQAVDFASGPGHELLVGLRRAPEFGALYTVGFGGTYVEALGAALRQDQGNVLYAPTITSQAQLRGKLERSLFFRWTAGSVRGVAGVTDPAKLQADLQRWVEALEQIRSWVEASGRAVEELELNPLVWSTSRAGWVPVDALLRLGPPGSAASAEPPFPLRSLGRALDPGSVALMGVSSKGMNVGRIIMRCVLDGGFPRERVYPIRDDVEQIDGVPCVASLDALPEGGVDLLVLAVAAAQVPEILARAMSSGKVGAVLLIPGGMGETSGGKGIEQQVLEVLRAAGPDRPAVIGNNSLGIVSRPAGFDSLFIPRDKLPRSDGGLPNVALISQSGAFVITAMTKLDFLAPDYQVSLGNQLDARVSHFVEALADAEGLTTYALYVEGLKPGDGARLAAQVRRIRDGGRDVVIYKAGRSGLGQAAAMGHTASVAGDYRVFADLLRDAGALVAETFEDFIDLVRLSATLCGRAFSGRRVALLSNAGYEAVGMADQLAGLEPAAFSAQTTARIEAALAAARIDKLVDAKNPLDLTPMAADGVHADCIEALLDDEGVDLGLFGNVPLTSQVQSLPRGISEHDVFDAAGGYAERVIALFAQSTKPFAVVIDAGRYYDALADHLQAAGVPTFRSADRATRLLGLYAEHRLRGAVEA
jgi:acyl-CoA synthetase (NDP forming)